MKDWISVKDRLPDEIGNYIVCCDKDDFRKKNNKASSYFMKKGVLSLGLTFMFDEEIVCVSYFCGKAFNKPIKITHWMSLPEPPKDSK